jgi:CBS domain-containing protein
MEISVIELFQQLERNQFGFFQRIKTVADLMSRDVITATLDDTLSSVLQLLEKHQIRHVPVIDPDGKDVVGVLSHRDVLRHRPRHLGTLAERDGDQIAVGMKVASIMKRQPIHVSPSATIQHALSLMLDSHIDCLLVYDIPSALQGILTPHDYLKALFLYHRVCVRSRELKRLRLVDLSRGMSVDEILQYGAQTARDVMSYPVTTLTCDQTVADAIAIMQKKAVRHVPVVDDRGHPVAIVSDRDILKILGPPPRRSGATEQNGKTFRSELLATDEKDPACREKVTSVMSAEPFVVTADSLLMDAVPLLLNKRIGCLPVVNSDNSLCGIVTITDILHAIRALQRFGALVGSQAAG